jgi:hypothetical protein
MPTPVPLPVHFPRSDEAPAHLIETIQNDGTAIVKDTTTGQLTTVRLGLFLLSGDIFMLIAVGPGSG